MHGGEAIVLANEISPVSISSFAGRTHRGAPSATACLENGSSPAVTCESAPSSAAGRRYRMTADAARCAE